VPLVWLASIGAAVLLALGISGTLSSWTDAIITNNSNTVGAAGAVALSESSGGTTCVDTATTSDNTATCSTINKYGGNAAMQPGDTSTVDVTFTDTGGADGASFGYAPGTCTSTPGPGGVNLCTDGDLTVAVACSTGATYSAANAVAALAQGPAAPGSLTAVTDTGSPALAAGDAITCEFTTTLSAAAKASDAGSSISQPIVWTLSSS